ncbi:serine hydrolase domain-containing protein [Brachybacterium sp. AOP43-C2-M15]|uniref:serine hydrolase domain-containing protein n=1 Tax=Brachybacterium sp. AOP43-C2-M15 TaxID=3457661 RepID=UPI004034938B
MDGVRTLLQDQVDAGLLPGAVALRSQRGHAHLTAVGVQDLESGIPMSSQTLFHWDSLGKPLTAALALTFVADGSLELDSPVDRWLPELSGQRVLLDPGGPLSRTEPANRPVTVQDLLTLRGGLGFTTDFACPFTEALMTELQEGPLPRSLDRDSFLRAAGGLPLAHQPGDGWTYNTGSTLLGLLLERVGEGTLDVLMAERLLEPLEMQEVRWWVPPAEVPRFAGRYGRTDDSRAPLRLIDPPEGQHSRPPSFPDGAGGLIGTANDWLTFGQMLLDGGRSHGRQVLPEHLVAVLLTNHLTMTQQRQAGFFLAAGEGWGFGGSVRSDGSYGWTGGAGTSARVHPDRGDVSILMTQVALDGPEGSPVIDEFEELVLRDVGGRP